MPVAPTYPGVYIEEIPSGVHTLTGVSTSITAFIGYTPRGNVDQPVHLLSFADFERAFGGIAIDSPLSYTVKHFFQNGGGEAYVVRVASGATPATVTLKNAEKAPVDVLEVTAASSGTWGNHLRLDIDYATTNPASLFNLVVTEFVDRDGEAVPGTTETFRNLSMNSHDPAYAVTTVNAGSQLIALARPAGLTITGHGQSTTGVLTAADIDRVDAAHNKLAFFLDGQGPYEITLDPPAAGGTFTARVTTLTEDILKKVSTTVGRAGVGFELPAPDATSGVVTIKSTLSEERSAVRFINAGNRNAAAILKLGIANGGTETEAAAVFRPAQTGTVGGPPDFTKVAKGDTGSIGVSVVRGPATNLNDLTLPLWGKDLAFTTPPATLEEAQQQIATAFKASAEPLLSRASVSIAEGVLRVLPDASEPAVAVTFSALNTDKTATGLGLTAGKPNVARYAPGSGVTAWAQGSTSTGNDGTHPHATELIGSLLHKTGIYALENVDIFNLLVMPDKEVTVAVQQEAIAYCQTRRAFMIIDAPEEFTTFTQAHAWIEGTAASSLRSRNAALYFPRLREPDPLMNGIVRTFPAAGALAGLYARTDAERGVWKAPAGTAAVVVGASGLTVNLTDPENGKLNQLGLNCLRTFPVYGTVSWGARTAKGADAQADDYKYIPVRRLALYLEESLYRGTQWAIFEPNDEPLWAQIRLNLGAFMHTLFAQGAFKGRTPREAYFVKCDKETTTHNDIDLGRVNVVVGFAPLKPAEFVIIQIQQIAGAIQT